MFNMKFLFFENSYARDSVEPAIKPGESALVSWCIFLKIFWSLFYMFHAWKITQGAQETLIKKKQKKQHYAQL